MMWFELDTHTFRCVVSEVFISDIVVECVPVDGGDMSMCLQSAKLMLEGRVFRIKLPEEKIGDEDDQDDDDYAFTNLSSESIKAMTEMMRTAIVLPDFDIPEDDFRFFPLARCMDRQQMVTWLVHETGWFSLLRRIPK